MKRIRESTVRVTGADGVTWEGHGDGLAPALRELGRWRRAGQSAAAQAEARWRLTPLGRRTLAHAHLFGAAPTGATGEGRP
jgi:hypothetical protein